MLNVTVDTFDMQNKTLTLPSIVESKQESSLCPDTAIIDDGTELGNERVIPTITNANGELQSDAPFHYKASANTVVNVDKSPAVPTTTGVELKHNGTHSFKTTEIDNTEQTHKSPVLQSKDVQDLNDNVELKHETAHQSEPNTIQKELDTQLIKTTASSNIQSSHKLPPPSEVVVETIDIDQSSPVTPGTTNNCITLQNQTSSPALPAATACAAGSNVQGHEPPEIPECVRTTTEVDMSIGSMIGLKLENVSDSVSQQMLIETFGMDKTEYIKNVCSCKIGTDINDTDGTCEKFAIITAPTVIAQEIIKLSGVTINDKALLIKHIPLNFYEMNIQSSQMKSTEKLAEDHILDFIFTEATEIYKVLSRCVILKIDQVDKIKDAVNVHGVIATGLEFSLDNNLLQPITSGRYYNLLMDKYNSDQQNKVSVKSKYQSKEQKLYPNDLLSDSSVTEITKKINNYDMNVCKQMKNKLKFLDRKAFAMRFDKGSSSREQIYVECSTANYEYL